MRARIKEYADCPNKSASPVFVDEMKPLCGKILNFVKMTRFYRDTYCEFTWHEDWLDFNYNKKGIKCEHCGEMNYV